jgi:hypothetical protein
MAAHDSSGRTQELFCIDLDALPIGDSGEPRVRDLDIAARAGLAKPLGIREVIEANMAELEKNGRVFRRQGKTPRRPPPAPTVHNRPVMK